MVRQVYFGGEAYPNLTISLGVGIIVAFLGAGTPKFMERSKTVWFEPLGEWIDPKQLEFDPENKWWQLAKKITTMACMHA